MARRRFKKSRAAGTAIRLIPIGIGLWAAQQAGIADAIQNIIEPNPINTKLINAGASIQRGLEANAGNVLLAFLGVKLYRMLVRNPKASPLYLKFGKTSISL